jgi:hypothetical protein
MTSLTLSAICSSTQAMLRASFLTGMTKLTVTDFGGAARDRLRREVSTIGAGSTL